MIERCQYLEAPAEVLRLEDKGDFAAIVPNEVDHGLCTWADGHPERLVNAPRWLQEWALSGGPNFQPQKHCIGCPGFTRRSA